MDSNPPDTRTEHWLGRLPRRLVGSIATFAWYTGTGWVGVLLLRRLVDPTLAGLAPSIAVPWLPVGFGVAGLLYFGRARLAGGVPRLARRVGRHPG